MSIRVLVATLLGASVPLTALAGSGGPTLEEIEAVRQATGVRFVGPDHEEAFSPLQPRSTAPRMATAAQDTFCLYGCPGTNEGTFQDASGVVPDRQGWTGVDLTDVPAIWQVSTFNAANLNHHGPGNHAMWAGLTAEQQPGWSTAPGYGNNWNAALEWRSGPLSDTTTGQTVELDFWFNHDMEPGYDYFVVEYDSAATTKTVFARDGSNEVAGAFEAPGAHFAELGAGSIRFDGSDYGGPNANEIVIRMVVQSDIAWSDEDGLWPTDGACQVDDVRVRWNDGGLQESFEDFEGTAPYAWRSEKQPYVGEFSKVFARFEDIDPCTRNETPVMMFLDDGTPPANPDNCCPPQSTGGAISSTWSYGVRGGWVVNYNGGLSFGEDYLNNEVWSPPIAWDLPGTADDQPEMLGVLLSADLWNHFEPAAMMWPDVRVRASLDGGATWQPWEDGIFFYGLGYPTWSRPRLRYNFSAAPTHIQMAVGVVDWSWRFGNGYDAPPSPAWDNVTIEKFRIRDVSIGQNVYNLFISAAILAADAFPASGSIDASNPLARDQLDIPFGRSLPGDSLAIRASALVPGATITDTRMVWVLEKNPFFEDAIRSAPARPEDENVDTSDPLRWTGEVVGQGPISGDFYVFDLPDEDFLYPGDMLRYYFRAEDDGGRWQTLPKDIHGFEDGMGYAVRYTTRCLPSIRSESGEQPSILVLMGDNLGPRSAHLRAFEELGFLEGRDFDVYAQNRHPQWGIGSGAHGGTANQLAGYSCIFAVTGGSGVFPRLRAPDLDLLTQWHELPGLRAGAYFGEDVVDHILADADDATGSAYVSTVLGLVFNDTDVANEIDQQISPVVRPLATGFTNEFVANGGCSSIGIKDFDSITPQLPAYAGHGFVDRAGNVVSGPAASVIHDRIVNGDRKVDITFPFPLRFVQNPVQKIGGDSRRAELVQEILDFVGTYIPSGPPTVVAPPRPGLADVQSYPNPFNPSVVIRFRLGTQAHTELKIFTLRGEQVVTLVDAPLEAGRQEILWDGRDGSGVPVSSGTYVYRLRAAGFEHSEKITLLK